MRTMALRGLFGLLLALAGACDSRLTRNAARAGSGERAPGRTKPAADAGEEGACAFVQCVAGAEIKAPLAVPFAEAITSSVEVCRNDQCFSGTWPSTADPGPSGGGVAFSLPDFVDQHPRREMLMSPEVDVTLRHFDSSALMLDVSWVPWSDSDLRAGDRYRVTMRHGTDTLLAIDRRVEMYDLHYLSPRSLCPIPCHFKSLEVNAAGECVTCDADGGAG